MKNESERTFTNWLLESHLIGRPGIHLLDERIFNFILLMSVCISVILSFFNMLQGLHIAGTINLLIFSILSAVIYYVSMRRRKYYKFFYCIILLMCTIVEWIYNGGGSTGVIQYFFLYTFILSIILLRGKQRILMVVLSCLSVSGLLTYEHVDGSLIIQYPDKLTRFIDMIVGSIFSFLMASLVVRVIYNQINVERKKSDELLLNILPKKIISELKEHGVTKPEVFHNVTVLFSDIVDFTKISETLPADILISELNDVFTIFDNITLKNHCERIKTIGDGYLATCGLPEVDENHCRNIVSAAIEMMEAIDVRNKKNHLQFKLRIGIHTGQVIGSVVGIKKYIYDVFGDTVNTTSRLEEISNPMEITASKSVIDLLDGKFTFSSRGRVELQGKGEMDLYTIKWNE